MATVILLVYLHACMPIVLKVHVHVRVGSLGVYIAI